MKRRTSKAARIAARTCVVIYVRVSTDEQVRSGLGLDAQEASCRAYAAAQGWTVVAVLREEAVSGKVHPTERPRFAEALALLASCEAGTLLVLREDRLSRRLRHLLDVLGAAEESGWQVATVDNGVLDEETDGISIHLRGLIAENERKVISKRTRDALAALKAQGVALGKPTTLPDDVLRAILDATIAGLTPTQTARLLDEQGVPTTKGGPWRESSVRRALASARARDLVEVAA